MRHPHIMLASILTLTAVTVGCAGKGTSGNQGGASKYASKATFTMAIPDDLGSFDPYHNNVIKKYYKLAYDSLINLQRDGKMVSGLAEKWTADASSATFTLRAGITCSDGAPLAASQVAAALNYAGDPKNQSSLYGSQVPSVPFKVTGDDAARTVRISMSSPFGFILRTLGLAPIVCAKGLKNPKIFTSASTGTGPFVLTSVTPGQSYTYTARHGYNWGPGGATTGVPGAPEKVVLRVVSNETTATNLLLSGELNFARIGAENERRLTAQRIRKVVVPESGAWLWFNHRDGHPTSDKRLREALVRGLNLDEVIKVNTGGAGARSSGLVAQEPRPCDGDPLANQLPAYDVAAAAALLDQAGWVKGPGGTRSKNGKPLRLKLRYVPAVSAFDKPTAELVAHQWEAIGVRVDLSADGVPTMNEVLYRTGSFDVYMVGLGTSLPTTAMKFVSGPVPPKGGNISGIDNKDYNTLSAKAAAMAAPQACPYWDQAEQALYRDVDLAPITNRQQAYFLRGVEAGVNGYDLPVPASIRVLK
jgi:peptide/nickel transport system substrate-binding protein